MEFNRIISRDIPSFLIKSTQGVTLTGIVLLTPFAIANIIQGQYLLSFCILMVIISCSISAWFCFHNQYYLEISLFVIVPFFIIADLLVLGQFGAVGSYWTFLAVISLYFILPKEAALIINIIFLFFVVPIAILSLETDVVLRFFAVLVGISFFTFISAHEVYKQHYLLKELAVTDTLTGLYNRSLLQGSLNNSISQNSRMLTPSAILMLDIDHFKKINDQFGHDVGDSVLKSTGDFFKMHFRTSDMVFRMGGEEFLVLLHNTDQTSALNLAENVCKDFEQLSLIPDHTVTISIGVANFQKDMDWKQWVKQADENLYQAKSNGRNRVVA